MTTPVNVVPTSMRTRWSALRVLLIVVVGANALLWGFGIIPSAPREHHLSHTILSLIIAGIVALPFRWAPVVSALACAAQLVEGCIFLDKILLAIDGTAPLVFATLYFAIPIVGFLASIALVLYRTPQRHPLAHSS